MSYDYIQNNILLKRQYAFNNICQAFEIFFKVKIQNISWQYSHFILSYTTTTGLIDLEGKLFNGRPKVDKP